MLVNKSAVKHTADFYLLAFRLVYCCLPKLIVAGFDLCHLAGDDEDRPLTDIGHPVRKTLQVVRRPQQPVGPLDGLGIADDE